jgi:hypothetical protein
MARGATGGRRGRPSGRRNINDQGFDAQAQLDFFNQLDVLHRKVAAATDAVKAWKNDAQARGGDKFILGIVQKVRMMIDKNTITPAEVMPMIARLAEYCRNVISGIEDTDEVDQIIAAAQAGQGAGAFPLQ